MTLLAIMISSFALLHPALSDIIPEDSFDTSFFFENSLASHDFDFASVLPFDNSNQPLDFSSSEAPSLEDNLFTDSSANTPLEEEVFPYSADPLLETSCTTSDGGYTRYVKRDNGICAPRTDEPLPFQVRFPTLDEIEEQLNEPRFKESNIPSQAIPPIPGISRNDNLCPKPKRRLCCAGPITELVPGFSSLYVGVNQCKGKIKALTKKDVLAMLRLL